MAAVGVTPDYIREMRPQGLPANDPDQAIQSRVLFPGAKGASRVRVAPGLPAAASAAVAGTIARSVSMANGIARSVAASFPPEPPAPPGTPDD